MKRSRKTLWGQVQVVWQRCSCQDQLLCQHSKPGTHADFNSAYALSFAEAKAILDSTKGSRSADDPQWQPNKVFQDSLGFAERFSRNIGPEQASQIRQ